LLASGMPPVLPPIAFVKKLPELTISASRLVRAR
jgi:hypothetical protein